MTITNVYSALFVDFDNMFSRLKESSGKEVAEKFARQPTSWLDWLVKGMSTAHFGDEKYNRRILTRKCYLNPSWYRDYRPDFTRAGFEVVDCPPLTSDGKTSTDIHMVMDIMDALLHPSHFDEFILFSADADFTPVLLRVRQHKRLSVVIAAGYSSTAYKSACDYLPPLDEFLFKALGVGQMEEEEEEDEKPRSMPTPPSTEVLPQLADLIFQKLETNNLVYSHELPALFRQVNEFRKSNTWLGFGSLKILTRAVVEKKPELVIFQNQQEGTWGIQRGMPAAAAAHTAAATHTPAPVEAKQPGAAEKPAPAADEAREELMAAISRHIIEYVKQSPKPVIMANLADAVRGHFARELEGYDGWVGVPSFSGMLKQLDLDGLAIKNVIPGFVWDPQRHAEPNPETQLNPLTDEFSRKYPRIEPLVSRIHQLTDMPYLLPVHYAMILTQVARTVNEDGFQLAKTTRLVRDRCVERGAPVARAHVNFVVIGISYAGHRLGESTEPEQPEELAEYLYKNAINLCQTAQMVLTDEDKALVHEWLFTCLGDPSIN